MDAVIHTVGSLLEGSEYKSIVNGGILQQLSNPMNLIQTVAQVATKSQQGAPYEESLQAKNRDACKLMAEHYNNACRAKSKKGHFVFLSAAPTIAPMLQMYI